MNEYRIEEAAQRRAEAEPQLYRADGSKVYGAPCWRGNESC